MPLKSNKNLPKNPAPNAIGSPLNYKNSDSPWGLEAFYEGYRLVFSASTATAGKWQKIVQLFKANSNKNPGSIISNVNLYDLFSHSARHAWEDAYALARKRESRLGVEDIFLALLKEPSVKNLLSRIKVDGLQAKEFINNYLKLTPSLSGDTVKKIPFEAFALAAKLHNHKVGTLMLLGGLLKAVPRDNILQAIFTNIGLSAAKLELFAVWLLDLDYDFPPDSQSGKLLFCLRQAAGLEEHFGYFFELPAIESAVDLSQGQTLKDLSRTTQQSPPVKMGVNIIATRSIISQDRGVVRDLQHLKALQLLVKAGLLAQSKKTKIISEGLVKLAAEK